MKLLFARQLSFTLLFLYASSSLGQLGGYNPTVPIKPPKIYHPNDQIHDRIYTRLTPVHADSVYQLSDNTMQDSLIDNDGNMYVTTWALGDRTNNDFLADQKECYQKIYDHMILARAFDLNEIREEDIKPNLFKDHGTCIMSHGYTLKSKNGFSPDKFKLNISRSHLESSTYMPVGAVIYLSKKSAQYADTSKILRQCILKVAELDNKGLIEEYSDVYTYVSIKPYVESVEICMQSAGYSLERINAENPK